MPDTVDLVNLVYEDLEERNEAIPLDAEWYISKGSSSLAYLFLALTMPPLRGKKRDLLYSIKAIFEHFWLGA